MGVRKICVVVLIALFSVTAARGQEFAREISQFVGDNARPFLQPVVDALHTDVHAGLFSPVAAEDGLHVGIKLVLMGIIIPDDQKTFRPKPYSKTVEFTYNGLPFLGDLNIAPAEMPTAAGLSRRHTFTGRLTRIRPKGSPYVPGVYDFIQQDATVTIGGFRDLSTILLATPQLTAGSFLGTELTVRFLPTVSVEDVGEVHSFGIGAKHLVSRYFAIPVDLTAAIMYHTLSLSARDQGFSAGLEMSTVSAQFTASRNFPLGVSTMTPYAGFGLESGRVDVSYDFADPYIGKQHLTFTSGSRFRFIAGLSALIWKIRVSADYNVGLMNGFSAGVGVEF